MAADIPTKEPLTIRAGDTIEWTKSIDDYKASDGWTLSQAASSPPSITSMDTGTTLAFLS